MREGPGRTHRKEAALELRVPLGCREQGAVQSPDLTEQSLRRTSEQHGEDTRVSQRVPASPVTLPQFWS